MRRRPLIVLGALACACGCVVSGARAEDPVTPPTPTTTTTSPACRPSDPCANPTTTSPPTTARPNPPTTVKGATTTSTTTAGTTGAPKPPPASGASQPLDPSLLGGLPMVTFPTTPTPEFLTESELPTTTTTALVERDAITLSTHHDGPGGATLALAGVAWLASLGGLLVYAEDQRAKQWRHLAR